MSTHTRSQAPSVPGARPLRPSWRRRLDTKGAPYAFIAPFFIVFAIFGAFPMIYTFWVSLHKWDLLGANSWVGLGNYTKLIHDSYFWNAVENTFGMFVLATVPQFVLALLLANTLNRKIRSRTLFRMGVLLPNITSVAAVALIFGVIFARDFGLANWVLGWFGIDPIDWTSDRWSSWTAISVMVDWRWTGYNALIFLAAMQAIPRDLYEAAAIDGASGRRQFFSITLPQLRPTLIFTSIIAIIGGVQLFTEPLLFNAGSNSISGGTLGQFQTVTMYLVQNAFSRFEFGYGAAIAWSVFLLILVVSMINLLILRRISSSE